MAYVGSRARSVGSMSQIAYCRADESLIWGELQTMISLRRSNSSVDIIVTHGEKSYINTDGELADGGVCD